MPSNELAETLSKTILAVLADSTPSTPAAVPTEILDRLDRMESTLNELRAMMVREKGEIVREFYTVNEVAERMNMNPQTIRQACNLGRIKAIRRQRSWQIPHETLTELLIHRELPPAPGQSTAAA